MSDGSDSDGDFNLIPNSGTRRYPVHDFCEFEDAESLRRLIFVQQIESDDSSSCSSSSSSSSSDDDASSSTSSDDNDSHDAAKRAAVGHSPVGVKIGTSPDMRSEADGGNGLNDLQTAPTAKKDGNFVTAGSKSQDVEMEDVDNVKKTPNEEAAEASPPSAVSTTVDAEASIKGNENGGASATITPTSETILTGHEDHHPSEKAEQNNEGETSSKEPIKQSNGDGTGITSPAPHDAEHEGDGSSGATTTKETSNMDSAASETPALESSKSMENLEQASGKEHAEEGETRSQQQVLDSSAKNSDQRQSKKKTKKKTPKPPKGPKYYCPYDLEERDEDENTPLHIAIHGRKLEHVRLLLEAGASPHRKCDGSAPIHTAISIASIPAHAAFSYDCVDLLMNHGADMTVKDDSLHTPLYLACMMNLPRVVGLIISDPEGMNALNLRADRVGGRPLHAAAKFDLPIRGAGTAAGSATGDHARSHHHHHPHHGMHGGVALRGTHHHPGLHRTHGVSHGQMVNGGDGTSQANGACSLTQCLLNTPGIEVDPSNTYGRTPLHIACMRGNWPVARMLLQSGANSHVLDHRGFTPGQLAMKRGMVIPNNLQPILGQTPASSQKTPPRDLIMDPDGKTIILCHELCSRHRSCPPITRGGGLASSDPPPENVRRLHVLINEDVGILRSGEFSGCAWESEARRAAMADVLKVHEYTYVEKISQLCSSIPDHPSAIAQLDPDTAVSRWSFESALRAAGSACEAVDKVMAGDFRNAFCAVRPPGHHAGPRGIVKCPNDPDGSHGFCLLNNVAIAAAYARTMYRNDGIRKVAIIDFDVHHGNGTEEIVRQLVPNIEQHSVRTPFAVGSLQAPKYKPWLDENDIHEVFFASTHGYGPRDIRFADHVQPNQGGWFYPASGKTQTTEAILSPSTIESPNITDFLLSQTWTRMGEESRTNCCKIINVGLDLPRPHDVPGMQRVELRDSYRKNILPHLIDFDPDMIFISAGFDGHKKDTMNFGYVGMIEDDYEWVTEQLVKVANTCCNGRIVSVLEGGYKIHGGIVSPFARSVASHVRALVEGGSSREVFDKQESEWESQFERHMIEEKEKKRKLKIERLNRAAEMEKRRIQNSTRQHHIGGESRNHGQHDDHHDVEAMLNEPLNDHHSVVNQAINSDSNDGAHGHQDKEGEEAPTRKRRRNQVDYKELYEQMRKETLA